MPEPGKEPPFRLDAGRVLEKLSRFQLPDHRAYALLLLRCAAAGGAAQVFIEPSAGMESVVFRWDGSSFTKEELESPFSCLFDPPAAGDARRRELAAALLGMLRLKPRWVTVRSGAGESRCRLHLRDLSSRKVEPDTEPRVETVVEAAGAGLWDEKSEALLRERCVMSDVAVYLRGKRLPLEEVEAEGEDRVRFDEDGMRGWVGLPEDGAPGSRIEVFSYGVLAAPVEADLGPLRVRGALNDDLLPLNLSRTGVLRGGRLKKALAAVSAAAFELVDQACRAQLWRAEESLSSPDPSDLRRLGWLRECAAGLKRSKGAESAPALAALRKTPLFAASDGSALTLGALEARLAAGGKLRVCEAAGSWEGEAPVRLSGKSDREALSGLFGEILETVPAPASEIPEAADTGEPGAGLRAALRALEAPEDTGLTTSLIAKIREGTGDGRSLVFRGDDMGEESWTLDASHPLIKKARELDGDESGPVLVSVLLRGLREALGGEAGFDEAALQASLAASVGNGDSSGVIACDEISPPCRHPGLDPGSSHIKDS